MDGLNRIAVVDGITEMALTGQQTVKQSLVSALFSTQIQRSLSKVLLFLCRIMASQQVGMETYKCHRSYPAREQGRGLHREQRCQA